MAYALIWSPLSRDDLHDIVRYIARDNPRRAQTFALQLIRRAEQLQEQPESGRMVPEHKVAHVREILFRPYRIVYRVDHTRMLVEIARVWHAARGTPEVPEAGE